MSDDAPDTRFMKRLEELAAIAQTGLTFATGPYDLERYERMQRIVAELMALSSALPVESVRTWLALDTGYATPKIDVRALILRGVEVLLVRERADGLWTLPGGWCDVGESPRACAEKEVREETGLEVEATRLLALFDKLKHEHPFQIPHSYKAFFLCEERGGTLALETLETSEVRYFTLDRLPELSRHRITARQIETVLAIARDPGAATAFD